MLSRAASIVGLILALAAVGAATLIVLPAPSMGLAIAAIAAGEKSFLIVGAGIAATVLALIASRPGVRWLSVLTVLLALPAIVLSLIPPAQALRLAGERRVNLDFGRYLTSRIDNDGPIKAERTVTTTTTDGRALGIDLYAPNPRVTGAVPVIVVVHGGGWSKGTKGEASRFSHWLAEHGYAVVDVGYQTEPQPNWKAAVGDVKCAIGWVKQQAAAPEWRFDPKRITLLGRSAGGHLALLAAYTPGDPQLPPSCAAADTTVESVVELYGPTDMTWGFANPANPRVYDSRARQIAFIGGPPQTTGDLYKRLSPTERVTPSAPRTLLIHGGHDQLVSKQNAELMADKLREAGVRSETLLIPYAQHGFDFIFGGFSEQIVESVLLRFLTDRPQPAAAAEPELPPDLLPRDGADHGAGTLHEGTGKDAAQ